MFRFFLWMKLNIPKDRHSIFRRELAKVADHWAINKDAQLGDIMEVLVFGKNGNDSQKAFM